MKVIQADGWKDFRESLYNYAKVSRTRKQQLLFRGQARTSWKLATTLDRQAKFDNDKVRGEHVDRLLSEFRMEVIRLGLNDAQVPEGAALELLARHHGLPSPILDWSGSPYVATYFGLSDPSCTADEPAAVWMLDRAKLTTDQLSEIGIVDEINLLQFNKRALRQRSLFLRIRSAQKPLEELLDPALTKFVIPTKDRRLAIADLDDMTINATNLLCDLDGAARTVVSRISRPGGLP